MLRLADFKNKKVLIMGLGLHGGGVGSAEFFSRLGSRVIVTDLKSRRELAPSVAKLRRFKNITYRLGGHRAADFRSADFIIKGPGVPEKSKFLGIAKRAGVPVLSDVEIFFLACPAPIIGITGTKGKSTTTWLLGQFLARGLHRRIWVGGNIRKSVLEFLNRINKNDLVVLELSSFQLDSLFKSRKSPEIALITNIFPDHLNRYASLAAYARSKAGIFRFQKPGDHLFINQKDAVLRRIAAQARSQVIRFNPERVLSRYRKNIPAHIPDFHLPNIAAAVAAARHCGVGERSVRDVLTGFGGMPDRMQLVRKIGGVEFINDTTATNPEAARQAIAATKRRIGRRRLVVIAGGYDKGLPVMDFVRALKRSTAAMVFLPGTATEKMKAKVKGERLKVWSAKTMHQA
ncbi:MAG: UDP-N-acetylmuramoyl-L-alanine--D-glutamate ligase, partial [bacterium]|nr:UDP-N-acetylmuramoyl-L-alanine--D-glutamate ligase [bacterium]